MPLPLLAGIPEPVVRTYGVQRIHEPSCRGQFIRHPDNGHFQDLWRFEAVAGVDLYVEHGELFSLLGPNGAGKTTTIKMLCCLLKPTSGTATIMGHDIQKDPLAVKRVIDISPQETAVAERLNAWENLSLMAGLHGLGRKRHERSPKSCWR